MRVVRAARCVEMDQRVQSRGHGDQDRAGAGTKKQGWDRQQCENRGKGRLETRLVEMVQFGRHAGNQD